MVYIIFLLLKRTYICSLQKPLTVPLKPYGAIIQGINMAPQFLFLTPTIF